MQNDFKTPSDPTQEPTIVQPPSNLPYVVAAVVMSLIGATFVVGITYLRPTQDNAVLIATVLGFLAPTTMGLMAFMKSQETHLSVNSRLDAFIRNARIAAHAIGRAEGVSEGLTTAKIAARAIGHAEGVSEGQALSKGAEPEAKDK